MELQTHGKCSNTEKAITDKFTTWIPVTSNLYALRINGIQAIKIKVMYEDEVIEEIRKNRDEYAKSFDYNLNAIFQDLKRKQTAHSHKVVKLPIKRKSAK